LLADAVTGDVDVAGADCEVDSGKLGAEEMGTSVVGSVGTLGASLDGRETELVITPVVVAMRPVTGGTA